MMNMLTTLNEWVWGIPLLFLLVGTGLMLTIRLRFLQVFKLKKGFQLIFQTSEGDGELSAFGSLCTALSATLGTGNIVGIASAIAIGGPGALFWLWVAAFFGMATKYAEGVLAIKYRMINEDSQVSGGPMYYIVNGMGAKYKPLAIMFAASGTLVALLGMGTFAQVNTISSSVQNTVGIPAGIVGIIVASLVALIIFGGLSYISKVAEILIPFMAGIYIIICLTIIGTNLDLLLPTLKLIFESAFTGTAAVGGFSGATMMMALRSGVARGVFSNESGLGSSPIAVATAKTDWAASQGMVAMVETFFSGFVICTLTGLSLIITGTWELLGIAGSELMEVTFNSVLPMGSLLLMISLTLFAFTTILGWNYYGERCWEFLFGKKSIKSYRILFVLMVALGAFIELEAVWLIADIMNGLMAFPNLIALLALSHVVVSETKAYLTYLKG